MTDHVLIDGDLAIFRSSFGAATVVVRPGTLTASGPGTLRNKKLCVDGDEASVVVRGCMYMTPQYTIPGAGTLEIARLADNHRAEKTSTGDKKVLLVGGTFTAKFTVLSPAQQPPPGAGPPVPDVLTQYSGTGSFVSTNTLLRGT
jgi:hypothetical protein